MLDTSHNELTDALDETAAEILHRAGVRRPPVNAIDVARRLGCCVLRDDRQSGRARIATVRAGPGSRPRSAIFLRSDPRPERIHWAVAHEIGEQCAADVCRRVGVVPTDSADHREQIANALATRLLLPIASFGPDCVACDFDLFQLKARYATASHELIARRMLDLTAPVLITIFDHGKLRFRRWNLPRRAPPLMPSELQLCTRVHESGEAASQVSLPRIDVWPVHEPGWKRELVRCEVPMDVDDVNDFSWATSRQ